MNYTYNVGVGEKMLFTERFYTNQVVFYYLYDFLVLLNYLLNYQTSYGWLLAQFKQDQAFICLLLWTAVSNLSELGPMGHTRALHYSDTDDNSLI